MESTKQQKKKQEMTKQNTQTKTPQLGAMDRCRAVLSIWTENRRPAEVCRELGVQYAVLGQWQDRAMEGMLQALEPRVNLEKGPALPLRLQKMLARKKKLLEKGTGDVSRLEKRLEKIGAGTNAKNLSSKEP